MPVDPLAALSDIELDAALARQFNDRTAALQRGDSVEAKACQVAARAILDELGRRLDAWIASRGLELEPEAQPLPQAN